MKRLWMAGALLCLFSCSLHDPAAPGLLVPKTVDQDPGIPALMINGVLLHVETEGNPTDPMVVLIHGGPGGDFRSLQSAKDLASEGFFVVFYDQRGSGLSQRIPANAYTNDPIGLMVADLDGLIAHFRVSPDQKVFLFGHSWGAMLATAYLNAYPARIAGAILAEPGGFTWTQTSEYLSRSNKIKFFSEGINDALYPEQFFAGRDEQEILDYKAALFAAVENAPGNPLGNAGQYPFWRSGTVVFNTLIDFAVEKGFDLTTHLDRYTAPVLFMYSELNTAYGPDWARQVSAPYPNVQLAEVKGSGHEMLFFGWEDLYPQALTYLNLLK